MAPMQRVLPPVVVVPLLAPLLMGTMAAIPAAVTHPLAVVMVVTVVPVPKGTAPTALHLAAEVAVHDGHPAEPAMAEPVVTEWWW